MSPAGAWWRVDPVALGEAAVVLREASGCLDTAARLASRTVVPGWRGRGATAGAAACRQQAWEADGLRAALGCVDLLLRGLAAAVVEARTMHAAAARYAAANGLGLDPDGTVGDLLASAPADPEHAAAASAARAQAAVAAGEVDDADRRTAAELARLAAPPPRRPPEGMARVRAAVDADTAVPAPPVGAPPVVVAAWWDGLTEGQRHRLAAGFPVLVGGLDGLPPAVRDRANRVLLGRARAVQATREAELG